MFARRSNARVRRGASSNLWTPASLGGLVLWLRADMGLYLDGSGIAKASDQSRNGNDTNQSNTAFQPVLGVDGDGKTAFVFDGSNDKWAVTDSPTLSSTTGRTQALWLKQTATNVIAHLFSTWHTAGQYRFLVRSVATNTLECYIATDAATPGSNIGQKSNWITAAAWTHVAVVYDGAGSDNASRLRLYINGVEVGFSSIGGTIPASNADSTANWIIGTEDAASNTQSWNGSMDDIVVCSRALTPGEIFKLYSYRKRGA